MAWLSLSLSLGLALACGAPPCEPVPALTLIWEAPAQCPDESEVRRRVTSYLSDATPMRELSARAVVEESARGWVLTLAYDSSEKTIEAPSCEELGDAAALILSLALAPTVRGPEAPVPELREAPSEAEEPEAEEPEAPASSPPIEALESEAPEFEPEPPQAVPARGRAQALLRADVALGVGVTPTLTSTRLVAGVVWPRARLEVSGTLWTPSDTRGVSDPQLVTMGTVQVHGCGVPHTRRLEFPLCAGLAVGALRVDERSASPVEIRHRPWTGASLSTSVVWRFRPYAALWFGPELTLGFGRVTVPLIGNARDYRTGLVAIRGALGIEFNFPSRTRARPGNRLR